MSEKYKTSLVFKISVLVLSLMLIACLSVRITYSRYISQSNYEIGYLAQAKAPIYLDSNEASDKILFEPTQWQMGNGQLSGTFTLSNIAEDGAQPPDKDARFRIRAFVMEGAQTELNAEGEDKQETEILTPEITLLADNENVEHPSKAETIKENTDFYKKNQKNGQFYCFYESIDEQNESDELEFLLQGGKSSSLTFKVTLYNAQISSSQIFICLERVK